MCGFSFSLGSCNCLVLGKFRTLKITIFGLKLLIFQRTITRFIAFIADNKVVYILVEVK